MNIITNDSKRCQLSISALKKVVDPEMNLNVVDMGLIYQMDFDEPGHTIYLTMTLTTRFCPIGTSLSLGVQRAIESVFPDQTVNLALTFTPHWTTDRISDEAKSFLTYQDTV